VALCFFHMQTDTRWTDGEGTEFASPMEAQAQAIVTCGEMMRDAAECFWGSRPWTVNVTDAKGLILWELTVDGFASPAAREFGRSQS
jgi:hypothetical protein